MRHVFLLLVGLSAVLSGVAQNNRPSPPATVSSGNLEINYSQPSKKGRQIFGALVPYKEVWRTGANEATTIRFAADGTFGGKAVKAGTYSLFTIPGEKEWTFILNSNAKQWGAYQYDSSKDVLRVTAIPQTNASPTETFTIEINGGKIHLRWDTVHVSLAAQ